MKKNFFLLFATCLLSMEQAMADNRVTVSDVNVPQGGLAMIEVGCEFDTEYTGFQLELSLPEGLTLLTGEDGYPVIEKAVDTNHVLTGNLLHSNGNYRFTCRSMDNISIPVSGVLFRVTLVADASLTLGTLLSASITACEFTRTADSQGETLADASFTISITEFRTLLDETSTTPPMAEQNANVRVKRTINTDEWSTICLPFSMTAEQIAAAFPGITVQLGDFNDYEVSADGESINVKFTDVTSIEANHPYIIKVSDKITDFTVDGVDIDPQEAIVDFDTSRRKNQPRQFVGTYVANTILDWGTLFLSGNKFWYSIGETKMKAFRAYFNFIDLIPDFEDNYDARIVMSFDEGTTGVNDRMTMPDDKYYNLNGQRVKPASKGLYIRNGKKVVLK